MHFYFDLNILVIINKFDDYKENTHFIKIIVLLNVTSDIWSIETRSQ